MCESGRSLYTARRRVYRPHRGTIGPKKDFDAACAAEKFKRALSIPGTEGKVFVNLLVAHDASQREAIDTRYRSLFGTDLYDDLSDEFAGNFREAVLALMTFSHELLVTAIHNAITGPEVDEQTLVEILCLRSSSEIDSLDKWYQRKYSRSLDQSVLGEIDGDFHQLLSGLLSASREATLTVDPIRARKDAQDLYDAGLGERGSDGDNFIRLLNTRSYAQLKETFDEYENIAQEPIEKTIEYQFKSSIRKGLQAIVQRVKDPLGFYAERLHDCLKGNDDKTLIRILVSSSETSLENIKIRYKEIFETSLWSDVRRQTTGDYGRLLLAIITP